MGFLLAGIERWWMKRLELWGRARVLRASIRILLARSVGAVHGGVRLAWGAAIFVAASAGFSPGVLKAQTAVAPPPAEAGFPL